jgi:hypothetical protein
MTHDDSVQIAATSPARRRAFARMGRAERASGRDTIGDIASGPGRTPVAWMMGSAARSRRKFSALQSLENSQNAERTAILRELVPRALNAPNTQEEGATRGWRGSRAGGDHEPIVDLLNRGGSVAGIAAREADGKRSRPEMAPQRLEKIESAPGDGMASEASNPPDLVPRRAAADPQEGQSWGETFRALQRLETRKMRRNLDPVQDSPTSPNCSRAR